MTDLTNGPFRTKWWRRPEGYPTVRMVLRDGLRRRHWEHLGVVGSSFGVKEYASDKPTHLPWFSGMDWHLFPWFGGDEWCRWTLVLPFPFRSLVIPLWGCRNPGCESCQEDCRPLRKAGFGSATT